MLSFLLWNVHKSELARHIANAACEHDVHVVSLVEGPPDTAVLLAELNSTTGAEWREVLVTGTRLVMVTRLPETVLRPYLEDPIARSAAAVLTPRGEAEILVFVAHLPDKWTCPTADQVHYLENFAADIQYVEARRGHRRSLVLGDLNANPFDPGMIAPRGLNAVATRDVASDGFRKLRDDPREYPFFYNPMWCHLGDEGGTSRGTYFRTPNRASEVHWNVLDQVLVRPDLLRLTPDPSVSVIRQIRGQSLLTPGGRPSGRFSDHLPVLCRLAIEV